MAIQKLAEQYKEADEEQGYLHTPGDGWHLIPSPDTYGVESAVLATALEFSELVGADFEAIAQDAGEPEAMRWAQEGKQYLSRPTMESDFDAILADLTDINYHTFGKYFSRYDSYPKG